MAKFIELIKSQFDTKQEYDQAVPHRRITIDLPETQEENPAETKEKQGALNVSQSKSKMSDKMVSLQDSPILKLLASHGFDETDIFEGESSLFPILFQFRELLEGIKECRCTLFLQ